MIPRAISSAGQLIAGWTSCRSMSRYRRPSCRPSAGECARPGGPARKEYEEEGRDRREGGGGVGGKKKGGGGKGAKSREYEDGDDVDEDLDRFEMKMLDDSDDEEFS